MGIPGTATNTGASGPTGVTGPTGPQGVTGCTGERGVFNALTLFTLGPFEPPFPYAIPPSTVFTEFVDDYPLNDGFTYFNILSEYTGPSIISGFSFPQDGRFVILVNNTPFVQYFIEETRSNNEHRLFLGIGERNLLTLDINHAIGFIYCANITITNSVGDTSTGRWVKLYVT
jgi:hypothetical protein